MMAQLVWRNLFHRPIRTLIGVVAIEVEVALVVLIVGLTSGLLQETAKRIEGIGADVMLQSPSAQIFLAFSGSPMPIKIADKLRTLKYVQSHRFTLTDLQAQTLLSTPVPLPRSRGDGFASSLTPPPSGVPHRQAGESHT